MRKWSYLKAGETRLESEGNEEGGMRSKEQGTQGGCQNVPKKPN